MGRRPHNGRHTQWREPSVLIGIGVAAGIVGGALLVLLAVQVFGATGVGKARRVRRQLVEDAEREAEAIRREAQIEAREQAVHLRAEIDGELADRRQAVVKIEERVLAKEEEAERKLVEVSRRDQGTLPKWATSTGLDARSEPLTCVPNLSMVHAEAEQEQEHGRGRRQAHVELFETEAIDVHADGLSARTGAAPGSEDRPGRTCATRRRCGTTKRHGGPG